MKNFLKIIPLFFLAYYYIDFFFRDFWSKSQIFQLLIGIPILILLFNLMRFIELIIRFITTRKTAPIILFKVKKLGFVFDNIHLFMYFLKVKQNESSFLIRKISFHNDCKIKSKVRFYKSIITEKYYVIDFHFFLSFFLKIISLSLVIALCLKLAK